MLVEFDDNSFVVLVVPADISSIGIDNFAKDSDLNPLLSINLTPCPETLDAAIL